MRHAWFFQDDELERWVSICIKCINHILWWYSVFRFQVLRQGGYLVAQPLDHSSLHSVLESRRNNFSENASVRMTSGPESSGLFLHLPPVEWFPNEVYYLQHLFFCWDSVGLESSGLLSSQRRKRRVLILQHLFCEMCSCMRTFWTVGWRNIAIDLVLYLVRKSCRTVFLYREMSTWELEYSFSISQNQITIMCNAREASVALASGASGSVLH